MQRLKLSKKKQCLGKRNETKKKKVLNVERKIKRLRRESVHYEDRSTVQQYRKICRTV